MFQVIVSKVLIARLIWRAVNKVMVMRWSIKLALHLLIIIVGAFAGIFMLDFGSFSFTTPPFHLVLEAFAGVFISFFLLSFFFRFNY